MIEKLTEIKGIGEKRAQLFNSLGIYIPRDLMHYMPRRYMDFTDIKQLGEVSHGTVAAFCVRVTSASCLFRAKGMQIVTCTVADATGKAQLTWFNQPYRAGAYRTGDTLYIYGRVDVHGKTIKISSPSVYTENPVIVPVYPLKKGITQSMIQNAVKGLLYQSRGNISETLPRSILEKYSLMGLEDALFALHFPQDMRSLAEAKRRLAFEDMMLFRIAMNYIRLVRKKTAGIRFNTDGVLEQYKKILPFELTEGQLETIADIQKDMSSDYAMNRLVQGDVGSGKTAVAFYAMKVAANNHMQSALLAPTEILASQHYKSLCGVAAEKDVCLLTGAMTKKQKETAYNRIKNGECLYVVGTHALLQEGLDFHSLGLIICDEQQRFGVEQREALKKKGRATDVLIMSATPIPRTLAHVMYGDVEVSKIKGMPKGRQPVRTRIVPTQRRSDMYTYLENEAKNGKQAYVVCPQIDNDDDEFKSVSVKDVYDELRSKLSVEVGLLHGKMKSSEKEETVRRFRDGDIRILVSTTVIEVGVDIPAAANMAIENADRFGLSQLHQLRGRIGRGSMAGYCFLVSDRGSECERLEALVKTSDGFEIAEKDLALRGPGEFLGSQQHGESELAMLSLACDMETLICAKEAADSLFTCINEKTREIIDRAISKFNMQDTVQ